MAPTSYDFVGDVAEAFDLNTAQKQRLHNFLAQYIKTNGTVISGSLKDKTFTNHTDFGRIDPELENSIELPEGILLTTSSSSSFGDGRSALNKFYYHVPEACVKLNVPNDNWANIDPEHLGRRIFSAIIADYDLHPIEVGLNPVQYGKYINDMDEAELDIDAYLNKAHGTREIQHRCLHVASIIIRTHEIGIPRDLYRDWQNSPSKGANRLNADLTCQQRADMVVSVLTKNKRLCSDVMFKGKEDSYYKLAKDPLYMLKERIKYSKNNQTRGRANARAKAEREAAAASNQDEDEDDADVESPSEEADDDGELNRNAMDANSAGDGQGFGGGAVQVSNTLGGGTNGRGQQSAQRSNFTAFGQQGGFWPQEGGFGGSRFDAGGTHSGFFG